jgi:regulator of sigma E protease
VLIHEGGHFIVAKKCNIKVLEFSIGFGKKLWSIQGKETQYSIRLIPLGGYVRMLGEEEKSDDERAFNNASVGKRLLVVFARSNSKYCIRTNSFLDTCKHI